MPVTNFFKRFLPTLLLSTTIYANPCHMWYPVPMEDNLVAVIPAYDLTITEPDLDCDEIIDRLDNDIDGDGVLNVFDAFPENPAETTDTDGDGIGNNADSDDDGDGYSDAVEIAAGSDPLNADITPPDIDHKENVFENGNDASDWFIYDTTPAGATVTSVYDADRNSNVIKFVGDIGVADAENGFVLGGWDNTDNIWNNTNKVIEWSMKFDSVQYVIYISVRTDKGHRYLHYTSDDNNLGYNSIPNSNNTAPTVYVHHGLGIESRNNTWQTFRRDLQADLQEFEPDNNIITVDGFLIRGSGRVDDIAVFKTY